MTTAQIIVTVAGGLAMIWVLWYFLAPPPPSRRGGTPPSPPSVPGS